MAGSDFVPVDVLAEDAGAFVEWDTENPDAEADRLGNITFNLGQHAGLMMKLKHLEGGQMPQIGESRLEVEYRRGWEVLEVINLLARVARRLAELGHVGNEANYAMFEEAARMCKEGLVDIEKQMGASPQWDGGVSNVNDGPLLPPAKPTPTPRPNPWDQWKGQKPWTMKRK